MITITIKRLDSIDAAVMSPFIAKDDVKAIMGARWSKDLRVWLIPTSTVYDAVEELRDLGYVVHLAGFRTVATPQVNEPWEAMFSAVPVALRARTYRALVKVLHPDVGGDPDALQALTAAFSKVGG